ncbi:MAG: tyrosine-type recombinase/integrase [Candidatus Omnitrophota bacterium]
MLEEYLKQGFSYDTQKTYKSVLTRFFEYLEEVKLSIEDLTPEVILSYAGKYKDTTRNKIISVIKTYYKWLTKIELVIEAGRIQSFRADRDLSLKDVRRLINSARNPREKLLIKLLITTGIRVAEAARLKKSDITIENGAFYITFIAKGNKERKIKLQSQTARELLKYESGKDTLFGIGRRHIERIIAELSKDILGRVVTPHCFRHGFATELMNQGVSFGKIKEALGHEKIETTLKYLHNNGYNENWFIDV